MDRGRDEDKRVITGIFMVDLSFLDAIFFIGRRGWTAGENNKEPFEGSSAFGRSINETGLGLDVGDKGLEWKKGVEYGVVKGEEKLSWKSAKLTRPSRTLRGESSSISSAPRICQIS